MTCIPTDTTIRWKDLPPIAAEPVRPKPVKQACPDKAFVKQYNEWVDDKRGLAGIFIIINSIGLIAFMCNVLFFHAPLTGPMNPNNPDDLNPIDAFCILAEFTFIPSVIMMIMSFIHYSELKSKGYKWMLAHLFKFRHISGHNNKQPY